MQKITGYCEVQEKERSIWVDVINVSCLEDGKIKPIYGRHECEYGCFHSDPRCNDCPLRRKLERK